jgi:hypothetical protein
MSLKSMGLVHDLAIIIDDGRPFFKGAVGECPL